MSRSVHTRPLRISRARRLLRELKEIGITTLEDAARRDEAAERHYAFDEACVVSMRPRGRPIGRFNLARGPRQLVVLADEKEVDVAAEDWTGRSAMPFR